ncbi:MAG TPA: hypothetical protein VFX05_17495, partial [Casimicrobiaceae bacterium]|nr:hypothetical protein [Casimicrobiaceae bacterium]
LRVHSERHAALVHRELCRRHWQGAPVASASAYRGSRGLADEAGTLDTVPSRVFPKTELEMLVTRTYSMVAMTALALGLAACGNNAPSAPAPKTGEAHGSTTVANSTSAPAAPADRDTPPAATPSTHTGTPDPNAAAAPTARDSAAQRPMDDLTKAKESSSLPLPGQVNNHSSPATDQPNKTTPETGGTKADTKQ